MKQLTLIIWGVLMATIMLFAQLPNTLSATDKIYGLSKFWQEVNYNFIYLNKIDRDRWNRDYKHLIEAVQKTQNDYEYYRLLQKFCATLKDGHTNVEMPKSVDSLLYTTMFGDYRLFLQNIDGKAIVVRVNSSKRDEIPIGTEIIKVNGIPTKQYKDRFVTPYLSSSTAYILEDWSVARLLRSPKGTTYRLTLKKPNGEIVDLPLTHDEVKEEGVYPPFKEKKLLTFKWIDDGIAYVALNSFLDRKIDTLFLEIVPELKKAKKLIIDLRRNGGGSTTIGTDILKYLTYDRKLHSSAAQSRLHIPVYKAWGQWVSAKDTVGLSENKEWAKKSLLSAQDNYYYKFPYDEYEDDIKKKNRIVVPTVLLTSHHTASAAEDFLVAADNQQHMTKIGERTFGSTGQPFLFDLPGGGTARVCTKKDTYPDGREFVGYGIKPDIEVKKTVNDYLNNEDPALQRAVEYLKKQ